MTVDKLLTGGFSRGFGGLSDMLAPQEKSGPGGAGNTVNPGPDPYRGGAMGKPTQSIAPKHSVAKTGTRWEVTYACGCPTRSFRTFSVALTFAAYHACPPPWAPTPKRSKRLTPAVR